MVGIGHLGQPAGGPFSTAQGISADGNVIVGQSHTDAGGGFPFRWTQATGMVQLGADPGTAWDTSADGSIIVGHVGGSEAFRWTAEAAVVPIGDLPGGRLRSATLAISDDGLVIVGKGETDAFE